MLMTAAVDMYACPQTSVCNQSYVHLKGAIKANAAVLSSCKGDEQKNRLGQPSTKPAEVERWGSLNMWQIESSQAVKSQGATTASGR